MKLLFIIPKNNMNSLLYAISDMILMKRLSELYIEADTTMNHHSCTKPSHRICPKHQHTRGILDFGNRKLTIEHIGLTNIQFYLVKSNEIYFLLLQGILNLVMYSNTENRQYQTVKIPNLDQPPLRAIGTKNYSLAAATVCLCGY